MVALELNRGARKVALNFIQHELLNLKTHPAYSEAWLHDRICEDTVMLGLGDLEIIDRERRQSSGGRLDMLLSDGDSTRYSVEIMLGATDPSHIVRCIEYWDIERRRYPAYDHICVLVAEEVTSRFLNFMGLLAGSIPLIAIQLNALRVGDNIVLDFVKVLDQRDLRTDDDSESGGEEVDRSTWEASKGADVLALVDQVLELANQTGRGPFDLKYKKRHIAITRGGSSSNVLGMMPQKSSVKMNVRPADIAKWQAWLEDSGLQTSLVQRGTRLRFNVTSQFLTEYQGLMQSLVNEVVDRFEK